MINLLRRLFIKDYNNIKDDKVRENHGKLASLVGIFSNLLLFVIKLIAGIISGSIAIIADSINNLSDMGSSIITLVGFKLASAPADEEHPYGHQRIEYISGLIVAIIIIFVGGNLLITSIDKIINYEIIEIDNIVIYISIGILSISILLKLWQSIFNKRIGKLINSIALEATASDSRNDCISTLVILIGNIVLLFWSDIPFSLDGVMGILVSLFIIIAGIKLIKETMNPLIGVSADSDYVKEIIQAIKNHPQILGVHDVVCHMYGPTKCFMTLHVEVDARSDLMLIHDVIDNIERNVFKEFGVELTIHMDPIQIDNEEINEIRNKVIAIVNEIDTSLSIHDFRVVIGPTHTNLIFDMVIPYKFRLESKEILKIIEDKISVDGKKYYFVVDIDREYIKR
ncbi:MAG: cation transporter [Acholeplasmatales bacterium]|nr:cation transporter [Acholeplasmatales bacterium]